MSASSNQQPTAAPPNPAPAAGTAPAPGPTPGYGPPPNPGAYPGGPYPQQQYPQQQYYYPQYPQPPISGMPQPFPMPPPQQGPHQMPPGPQPFPPGPQPGFAHGPPPFPPGQPTMPMPEGPPPMLLNEPFANFVNHMSQLRLESGASDEGFRKSCSIIMQLDMENFQHECRKLQRRGFTVHLERIERQQAIIRKIRKQFAAEFAKLNRAATHRVQAIAQMHMNALKGEQAYVLADLTRLKHADERARTLFDVRETVEKMKETEHPFLFSETTIDIIAPFLHRSHSPKSSRTGSPRYTTYGTKSPSKSSSKSSKTNPIPTPPKSDGAGPTATHDVVHENPFQCAAARAWELFDELMGDLENPDWRGASGNPADTVFAELAVHVVAADQYRKLRGSSLRKVLVDKLNDERRRLRHEGRAQRHGDSRDDYDSDQILSPRFRSPRSPKTPLSPRTHGPKSPHGSHRSHHTKYSVAVKIKSKSAASSSDRHKFKASYDSTPAPSEYQHYSKPSSSYGNPPPPPEDHYRSKPSSYGNTPALSEHHESKDITPAASEDSRSDSAYAKSPAPAPSEYLYGTSDYSGPTPSGDGSEAFTPIAAIPHAYAEGSEQERFAHILAARVQPRRMRNPNAADARYWSLPYDTDFDHPAIVAGDRIQAIDSDNGNDGRERHQQRDAGPGRSARRAPVRCGYLRRRD